MSSLKLEEFISALNNASCIFLLSSKFLRFSKKSLTSFSSLSNPLLNVSISSKFLLIELIIFSNSSFSLPFSSSCLLNLSSSSSCLLLSSCLILSFSSSCSLSLSASSSCLILSFSFNCSEITRPRVVPICFLVK